MKRLVLTILTLSLAALITGCVRRIVAIDSQPQGAQVYFDRKLIGETPCNHEFFHYGGHHLELTKDGYANLNTTLNLKGPLYEYFPLSVFSELLIPWQITDEHSFAFKLEKGQSKKAIITPIEQPQPGLPAPHLERVEERIKTE